MPSFDWSPEIQDPWASQEPPADDGSWAKFDDIVDPWATPNKPKPKPPLQVVEQTGGGV
jgi:hypothetical protein